MKHTEPHLEHSPALDQMKARRDLAALWRKAPIHEEDLLFNLPLYMRSGLLAKVLVMNDIYRRILPIPGLLCEFGVWLGMNLVLLENLRAVHETFNKQRKIIGFDSFCGYDSGHLKGLYSSGKPYIGYLTKLLDAHERCNAYGHSHGNHELIEGDVTDTAPAYFAAHPETVVALAYFDIGPEAPTLAALRAIKPHLVRGSVIVLDEFTWPKMPGEAIAFKTVFKRDEFDIETHPLYRTKSIVTIR